MRTLRVYHPHALSPQQTVTLTENACHHLRHVLRVTPGMEIILFNGQGGEYTATISAINKQIVTATIHAHHAIERESPCKILLAQVISRGDKMDFTLQKAVELGVHEIIPLTSTRCGVQLNTQRITKKTQHWKNIIMSACEQCGRNTLPALKPVLSFSQWMAQCTVTDKFILHPENGEHVSALSPPSGSIALTIGPEGGFSAEEISLAQHAGFTSLQLGPRILRTETAGLVALACLQSYFGDLR